MESAYKFNQARIAFQELLKQLEAYDPPKAETETDNADGKSSKVAEKQAHQGQNGNETSVGSQN